MVSKTDLKEILWRPGVLIVLTLYGALQLVSNLIAWTLPAEEQAKYQFIKLLTWRVWLIATPLLTLILIGLIVRAAHKVVEKRDVEHKAEIDKVNEAHKAKIEQKEEEHKSEQSKLIEGHAKVELALMRLRETEVEGLKKNFRLIHEGQLKREEETRKRNDALIANLRHKLTDKVHQIYKLTTYKLKFEIDAPSRSFVTVTSYYDEQFSVMMRLYIRFENSDVHPLTVKGVSVLLIKKDEDDTESEIPLIKQDLYEVVYDEEHPLSKKEYKWDSRNLSVGGRDWTPYHTIDGHINADGDYRKILDSSCFLRVTMEAMNQPPYSLDFDVNWEGIHQGWVQITPRR